MTGTNEPIAICLSAASYDYCVDDTNFYSYILMGGSLTNGFLSGTPPNLIYTPTNGEGIDSFQFNVSDGVWTQLVYAMNFNQITVTERYIKGGYGTSNGLLDFENSTVAPGGPILKVGGGASGALEDVSRRRVICTRNSSSSGCRYSHEKAPGN